MTPQSTFMVMAEIADGRRAELEALLAGMNRLSCIADPANSLVPFGAFERLHVARFVILDSDTRGDTGVYGETPRPWAVRLAMLGDCDGPAETFLDKLVARAGNGLRRIFAHCRDFGPGTDMRRWMNLHTVSPSAVYVNWLGRTVARIREDAALRDALVAQVRTLEPEGLPPARLRDRLFAFMDAGNGLGFPRVSWLLRGGAKFEGKYNRYLRRHQIPTQVWYKAYLDLSVADLNRNSRIREGIERRGLGERETLAWLALL
jgi:hypothetical protein